MSRPKGLRSRFRSRRRYLSSLARKNFQMCERETEMPRAHQPPDAISMNVGAFTRANCYGAGGAGVVAE